MLARLILSSSGGKRTWWEEYKKRSNGCVAGRQGFFPLMLNVKSKTPTRITTIATTQEEEDYYSQETPNQGVFAQADDCAKEGENFKYRARLGRPWPSIGGQRETVWWQSGSLLSQVLLAGMSTASHSNFWRLSRLAYALHVFGPGGFLGQTITAGAPTRMSSGLR